MPSLDVQKVQSIFPQGAEPYQQIDSSGLAGAAHRLGATLEQASDMLAQHAVRFQDIQNEKMASDADVALGQKAQHALFDPDKGYFTKFGKDAVDAYPEIQKTITDLRQQTFESLPNPAAQRMFDSVAKRRTEQYLERASVHAAQQNKVWHVGTLDAQTKLAEDTAANFYNDDRLFSQSAATMRVLAQDKGAVLGYSPEQVAEEAQKNISKMWARRVDSAMLRDPDLAQKLYSDNAAQFDANDRPQIEGKLKGALYPVQARNIAASVLPSGDVLSSMQDARANLAAWIKKADAAANKMHPDDPVFRDHVTAEIERQVNIANAAREGVQRAALHSVLTTLYGENGTGDPDSATPAIQSPAWQHLEPQQRIAIVKEVAATSKRQADTWTDEGLARWNEINGMKSNQPEAWLALDPTKELGKGIPRTELVQLSNQIATVNKHDAIEAAKGERLSTAMRVIGANRLLESAGINGKPKEKDVAGNIRLNRFTGALMGKLDQFAAQNKRGPTDSEILDIGRGLVAQVAVPGRFFGSNSKPLFDLSAAEEGTAKVNIPGNDRADLSRMAKARYGRELSDGELTQLYIASQTHAGDADYLRSLDQAIRANARRAP